MPERRTPRQLAREETLRRIKALALEQLGRAGAAELSLRAIAREIGIVSSAIYRYFASRDELLTALIIDAYDDLADALERAGTTGRDGRTRWLGVCAGFRAWALAEPHRFALIYGTTIPGYRAPQDTVAPAARVVRAFLAPATDACPAETPRLGRRFRTQLAATGQALAVNVEDPALVVLLGAFARVIGLLTLELGGHLVGSFEPADDLFTTLLEQEADRAGLSTGGDFAQVGR